jgi:hypothetical protein
LQERIGNQQVARLVRAGVVVPGAPIGRVILARAPAATPEAPVAADAKAKPLDDAQVKDAIAWYRSQPKRYTPEIITEIQKQVGAPQTGTADEDTAQAVAVFQGKHPPLKVDGKAGPRTLPTAFQIGLRSTKSTAAYIAKAKTIAADWVKLGSAEERAKALLAAANEQLAAAKVPPVTPALKDEVGELAHFAFQTWTMVLGKKAFAKNTITDDEARAAAATVYHEARHAEQWFMMARLLAGQGLKKKAISKRLNTIPEDDVAKPAQDLPLAKGSMEALIAQGWFDSVYGGGSAHRDEVLSRLKRTARATEAKQKVFDKKEADRKKKEAALTKAQDDFSNDPSAANGRKVQAAQAALDAAQKSEAAAAKDLAAAQERENQAIHDTVDLPEETDAAMTHAPVKAGSATP